MGAQLLKRQRRKFGVWKFFQDEALQHGQTSKRLHVGIGPRIAAIRSQPSQCQVRERGRFILQ
jgi:hypothetical protein